MKKQLARIRNNIDVIDQRLVTLINRRLQLAAKIGELKRSVTGRIYVAEREAEVIARLRKINDGPLKETALSAIYREIMSAALALEKPLRIAYLGPEATNTHQAALKKFGASVEYHALTTIGDVFTAVEKGEADYGVVPLENSTQGAVRDAHDLFVDSNVLIVAELYLDIQHALLSNSPLDRITKVYSKDQALAQCRQWLERNLTHARLVDVDSTAHGVQLAKKEKGAAAVAARIAGERYGVAVLADKIQDQKNNVSRFCIIGREPSGALGFGRDKTSLIVSLHDEPGALLKMLKPFSRRGLNMTRIESRPSRARQWDYYFFIDITGHYDEPGMQAALKELKRMCPLVKSIGGSPAAKR